MSRASVRSTSRRWQYLLPLWMHLWTHISVGAYWIGCLGWRLGHFGVSIVGFLFVSIYSVLYWTCIYNEWTFCWVSVGYFCLSILLSQCIWYLGILSQYIRYLGILSQSIWYLEINVISGLLPPTFPKEKWGTMDLSLSIRPIHFEDPLTQQPLHRLIPNLVYWDCLADVQLFGEWKNIFILPSLLSSSNGIYERVAIV